jgi:hypothetical protein
LEIRIRVIKNIIFHEKRGVLLSKAEIIYYLNRLNNAENRGIE